MVGRVRGLLAAVVLAGAVAGPAAAQEQPVPEPYDPEEFAPALRHLRRAEVVAVGSFPFALLFTTLVYDYARWAGSGFLDAEAPFRRGLDQDPFSDGEKVGIALAAVGVSVAVAAADYLLGQAGEEPRYSVAPRPAARARNPARTQPAAAAPELRYSAAPRPAAFDPARAGPTPSAGATPAAGLFLPSLATLWPGGAPGPGAANSAVAGARG